MLISSEERGYKEYRALVGKSNLEVSNPHAAKMYFYFHELKIS